MKNNNDHIHSLSLIERMERHMTLNESDTYIQNMQIQNYADDVFDLTKIPEEVLKKNYVSYSPYRLAIGHGSPLQFDNDGNFLSESINHEANAEAARNEITKYFPIDVSQFIIVKSYHKLIACVLVANIRGNIDIVTQCMKQYNFFPSRKMPNQTILSINGEEWVDLRFEPIEQDDVTEKVRQENDYLLHLSPIIFENNILHNGLKPSNSNPVYKYPTDRLHLIEQRATKNDVIRLARNLYQQAIQKNINGLIPKYSLFQIDVNKVPASVRFYEDINEEFGLFTPHSIPSNAIHKIDEINIT